MKKIPTLFFVLTTLACWAQENIQATNEFAVMGQIKKELKISLTDIEKFPSKDIPDVAITNHLGEARSTA